jgi:hypothetical protein
MVMMQIADPGMARGRPGMKNARRHASRWAGVAAVVLACLSLAACGGDGGSDDDAAPPAAVAGNGNGSSNGNAGGNVNADGSASQTPIVTPPGTCNCATTPADTPPPNSQMDCAP